MIHNPLLTSILALVIAQSAGSDLPGIVGEAAGPAAILGSMVIAERYLAKARREALALSRETAKEAVERLDEEQARWYSKEAALNVEIMQLRDELKLYKSGIPPNKGKDIQ